MTSSDQKFFTVYFDSINGRLTRIEDRMTNIEKRQELQENALMKIQSEQQIIINRIDVQDRLIWGGIGWFTLVITFMMFLQSFMTRGKSEIKSKSIITLEAVKELMSVFKPSDTGNKRNE